MIDKQTNTLLKRFAQNARRYLIDQVNTKLSEVLAPDSDAATYEKTKPLYKGLLSEVKRVTGCEKVPADIDKLQTDQEQNEDTWTALTDTPITELNLSDPGWDSLANGYYRWAVKAIYTNNVTSVASFSNVMHKFVQTGMIVGTVRRTDTSLIVGATVTNGTVTATTNSQGAYILTVPVGYHSVTASAAGYDSLTIDDVLVNYNLTTTVNFILSETPNDEYEIPVVATALNGNYPNPFNPETTISYSVKEPGKVKLEVYNIRGQLVRTLVDEDQATGHYKLIFNAKDDKGRGISSGVYLLRMQAPGYKKTSKMILMQ